MRGLIRRMRAGRMDTLISEWGWRVFRAIALRVIPHQARWVETQSTLFVIEYDETRTGMKHSDEISAVWR
jgi:hypothetical protein